MSIVSPDFSVPGFHVCVVITIASDSDTDRSPTSNALTNAASLIRSTVGKRHTRIQAMQEASRARASAETRNRRCTCSSIPRRYAEGPFEESSR